MTLVLASGSASRAAMLSAAGVAFEVVPSAFDEDALKARMAGVGFADLALALAQGKAVEVSARMPGRLVIGGDSIASVGGERFGKPASREDAERHLRAFSGRDLVLTSAAVLARDGAARHHVVDAATLAVRELSPQFIAWYLDREWPAIAHCAGCFRIEGPGVHLFERSYGDHFTILGMPLLPLLAALREEGVTP